MVSPAIEVALTPFTRKRNIPISARLAPAAAFCRVPLAMVALVLFAAALVVQVASLLGIDVESRTPQVWLLHYLIFPITLLAVLTMGALLAPERGFRELLRRLPWAARLLIGLALLYAIVNFTILAPATGMGQPIVRDGKFFFFDHGTLREVDEAQFRFHMSRRLALYSGVWTYLYLTFGVALLAWRRP